MASEQELQNLFITYHMCKDMCHGDLDYLNFSLQYMYFMKHGEHMPSKMIETLHLIMKQDIEHEAERRAAAKENTEPET